MNKREQKRRVAQEKVLLAAELLKNELQQIKALHILTRHHNLSTHDIKVFAVFCSLYISDERKLFDHQFQNLKYIYKLIREEANKISKHQGRKFINTSQKNIKESVSKLRRQGLIKKGTRKQEKKRYPELFESDKTRKKQETWQIGTIKHDELEKHRTHTYNLPISSETLIQAIIQAYIPYYEEAREKVANNLTKALKELKSDFTRTQEAFGLLRMFGLDPKLILRLHEKHELEAHIQQREQEEQQKATPKNITIDQFKLKNGIRHLWDDIDHQLNDKE